MKLNDIKKSFDRREIKPSPEAWERLSERLDQDKSSGQRPLIYWLSAVAAIILMALLVSPFLQTEMRRSTLPNEIVVEENTDLKAIDGSKEISREEDKMTQEAISSTSEQAQPAPKESVEESNQKSKGVRFQASESELATAQVPQKQSIKNQTKVPGLPEKDKKQFEKNVEIELLQAQLDTEMAMATAQKLPASALTPEEEAALLLNQALEKETQTSVASRKINPDQLLRETEWDIEADRRNQLNDAIFDGLGRLKAEAYTLITKKQ